MNYRHLIAFLHKYYSIYRFISYSKVFQHYAQQCSLYLKLVVMCYYVTFTV